MKIKPLYDNVLIKPIEEEQKTASGIVLPDSAKEKPTKGEIIEVGQGRKSDDGKLIEMSVKIGDKVLFKEYGFNEIEMDGETYLIGSESGILGILK